MHADLVFLLFTITLKFASHNEISQNSLLYQRLAFDELLAHQLQLAMARNEIKRIIKEPLVTNGILTKKLIDLLPYQLTN